MRENQPRTGTVPQKKPQDILEELQTRRHPVTRRGTVFGELVKAHEARPGHPHPGRRCVDKWDPPRTLFAG
jgi:hypothetical protein